VCGGGQSLFDFGQKTVVAPRSGRLDLKMIKTRLLLALFAAVLATAADGAMQPASEAPAAPSAAQLATARFAGMHMAATLLYRGVKAAVTNRSDVREQVHEAEGLAYWGAAIPGLFPAGSGGESRARPEIWANWSDFEAKATDLRRSAERLMQLARAGDTAGFAAQADAVEAACSACHTAYRAD
jgi:cytochrome c556